MTTWVTADRETVLFYYVKQSISYGPCGIRAHLAGSRRSESPGESRLHGVRIYVQHVNLRNRGEAMCISLIDFQRTSTETKSFQ